jgi:hypothetical protein
MREKKGKRERERGNKAVTDGMGKAKTFFPLFCSSLRGGPSHAHSQTNEEREREGGMCVREREVGGK